MIPEWPPSSRMCGVCKRVLDSRSVDPSGRYETIWMHTAATLARDKPDHAPVPVEIDPLTVRGFCDLCGTDDITVPDAWVLPCEDFTALVIEGQPTRVSVGDFMCCGDCAELLGGNRWGLLEKRMIAAQEQALGREFSWNMAMLMINHIDNIRAAMKGPPYLEYAL